MRHESLWGLRCPSLITSLKKTQTCDVRTTATSQILLEHPILFFVVAIPRVHSLDCRKAVLRDSHTAHRRSRPRSRNVTVSEKILTKIVPRVQRSCYRSGAGKGH